MEAYMNPGKEYVLVNTDWLDDGQLIPRSILYGGRRYEIEQVVSRKLIQKAEPEEPQDPGQPRPRRGNHVESEYCDELTIVIRGQQTKLYFERWPGMTSNYMGRWFVLPLQEGTGTK